MCARYKQAGTTGSAQARIQAIAYAGAESRCIQWHSQACGNQTFRQREASVIAQRKWRSIRLRKSSLARRIWEREVLEIYPADFHDFVPDGAQGVCRSEIPADRRSRSATMYLAGTAKQYCLNMRQTFVPPPPGPH